MCDKEQEPLDFNLGQLYRVFHYPCLISCRDLCWARIMGHPVFFENYVLRKVDVGVLESYF